MSLHSREAVNAAVEWLASLPKEEMDRFPVLWAWRAAASLASGRTQGVEESLASAEAAAAGSGPMPGDRNLEGRISMARATLALTRYDARGMIGHSLAALEALDPGMQSLRATASWVLGTAYLKTGMLGEAERVFDAALAESRAAANVFSEILIMMSLGEIRESRCDLHGALAAYEAGIALAGEHPLPSACEAYLGKARVLYEWDMLAEAEASARRAQSLAKTYGTDIDRFIPCELLLARIELALGRVASASAALEAVEGIARRRGFAMRLPEIAAAKVAVAISRDNGEAALRYAKDSGQPRLHARALLARGRVGEGLAVIEDWLAKAKEGGWTDELLRSCVVHALALVAAGRDGEALAALERALIIAEPCGAVRCFSDEGARMAGILDALAAKAPLSDHASRVLAACGRRSRSLPVEPLSPREREVLALIAQGLSNQEIGERLFLALDSVKGNNRRIFEKLGVQRRTEAVARARERGII
jgi:LuxR family maltose regulon positive regulatory protein